MCDTVAIITDDGVLVAKNSDRDPNEGQALEWHAGATHAPHAAVTCTHLQIPQVSRTYAIVISRPYWMWGAEMGANEHGVVIGNEAVFTRAAIADVGLTGMDLVRLALERSATAEEACETIIALLHEYGQGGGCGHERRSFTYHNSFLLADPKGAIVLETADRHWATERVEQVRSISNGLSIAGFAEEYGDRVRTRVACARQRCARTLELARTARDAGDLMALLRDHGDGRAHPRYSWISGGMAAPCMHAGGLVAASQTTASWVSDLRDRQGLHWVTATSAPCTALFKPVRIDEPVALGAAPGDIDDGSLWWRHERLHRRVMQDPERLMPLIARERDDVQAAWLADSPGAPEAFAQGNKLLESWLERAYAEPVRDGRPVWVRRYWRARNMRAQLKAPEARAGAAQ